MTINNNLQPHGLQQGTLTLYHRQEAQRPIARTVMIVLSPKAVALQIHSLSQCKQCLLLLERHGHNTSQWYTLLIANDYNLNDVTMYDVTRSNSSVYYMTVLYIAQHSTAHTLMKHNDTV